MDKKTLCRYIRKCNSINFACTRVSKMQNNDPSNQKEAALTKVQRPTYAGIVCL